MPSEIGTAADYVAEVAKTLAIPDSDLSGVLYIALDGGEWKFKLQRRLKKIPRISLKDD